MDVATDTCVLINLVAVGRLDLLKTIPPFLFHAAIEVVDEIEDLDQKAAVEQAIAAGHFDKVKLDRPGELELFVNFNAMLGKGESACLALAKARGWAIATDESKDSRWKKVIAGGSFAIINTPGILLAAIRAGALTIEAADQIKMKLEQRRFKMKFDSFRSLV
jgi:predicted nucleic acid-binding protein